MLWIVANWQQLIFVVLSSSGSAVGNDGVIVNQDADIIPDLIEFARRRFLDQMRRVFGLLRVGQLFRHVYNNINLMKKQNDKHKKFEKKTGEKA